MRSTAFDRIREEETQQNAGKAPKSAKCVRKKDNLVNNKERNSFPFQFE